MLKPQKPSPPEGGFDRTIEHLRCWCIVVHAPISFQENYMADSFGANLMVGLLSVREAGHVTRFVMGLEYFSPVRATGSRRVLDVQKSVD